MFSRKFVIGFLVLVVAILGINSVFIVNEMERAVLLEFGAVVRHDINPGFHVKWPFINDVRKFDARVLTSDAPPERFLTLEKKAVIVDSFSPSLKCLMCKPITPRLQVIKAVLNNYSSSVSTQG